MNPFKYDKHAAMVRMAVDKTTLFQATKVYLNITGIANAQHTRNGKIPVGAIIIERLAKKKIIIISNLPVVKKCLSFSQPI